MQLKQTLPALTVITGLASFLAISSSYTANNPLNSQPQWLAGDHHVHSRYSVGWDRDTNPPTPILAGDAIYPIPMNTLMGRRHGLDWMVSTDIGGALQVQQGEAVDVTIRFRQPATPNFNGDSPRVHRIDLIAGPITGKTDDPHTNTNPGTRVVARFHEQDWRQDGDYREVKYRFDNVDAPMYLRLRGTNTDEQEPSLDGPGENPWQDLWFYSNPTFIEMR